ncbi:NAD(P)H-dependent oxidoreductase [Caulobacter segnis]|uniref:FMN-dependent NADH-azoreductase n=1 Tax=Caulobacter segnis TaxID=88688 RepID=UPI00240EB307|nr:NAD(P)H-dependent oxidoreductase [Caulobacter segnis]MDG2521864.1 NAD(P)H-dependent oxidoreductase [Caulobacter segnis]
MTLLHIDSSILGDNSVSRQVSAAIATAITNDAPATKVVYRDLAADPLPHLSGAHLGGVAPQAELDAGAEALEQFLAADIIVIGAPMYNFTISSQLKAWIDRILAAGKTFRYGPNGVEGLAGGKRVIVALSKGGYYGDGQPAAGMDFQEPYLKAIFGFIGIHDVEFVRAEGIAVGPEQREQGIASALASVTELKRAA